MVKIVVKDSQETIDNKVRINVEKIKSLANRLPNGYAICEIYGGEYAGYDSYHWTNLYIVTERNVEEVHGIIFKHRKVVWKEVNIANLGQIYPDKDFAAKEWNWELYDNSLLDIVKTFSELVEQETKAKITIHQVI